MQLPWWGWILVALALLVIIGRSVAAAYRRRLRNDFRAYLHEHRPDLRIVEETTDYFQLADADGNEVGTAFLHRLYGQAPRDAAQKQAVFERFLAAMSEADILRHLGPQHADRVLPRIVTDDMLSTMRAQSPQELPAVALGVDDLSVVFVLDSEASVAYLGAGELEQLGLTADTALDTATRNLAAKFREQIVREAVDKPNVYVVKNFDSYDAARLLVVPQYMREGETLVALIPDRDTLVLVHPPANDDWSSIRKLATNAAGDPLYMKPLIVTSAGITAASA